MLEGALVAGLTACGCNAILLGVVPTPAVAYLTIYLHADAGVVISASHNPYEHNGIKMFSSEGLQAERRARSAHRGADFAGRGAARQKHGGSGRSCPAALRRNIISTIWPRPSMGFEPLRVLIDCANGAASTTARYLFGRFPLEAEYLNDKPNGVNINGCGSTHLEALCDAVKAGDYDLGIAFDGDADRCLTVDEQGCVIDGDKMMAICADAMEKKRPPAGGGFVATVMSNIGLHKYCAGHGLRLLCASVGDRNVLELMQKEGMRLGGEQSGHIIFLDYMPNRRRSAGRAAISRYPFAQRQKASELSAAVRQYPQLLQMSA